MKTTTTQTIRAILRSGKRVTAKELNTMAGTNDARKQISDLRKEGWSIQDIQLSNRCKLYWLAEDKRQGELFQEGGTR